MQVVTGERLDGRNVAEREGKDAISGKDLSFDAYFSRYSQ